MTANAPARRFPSRASAKFFAYLTGRPHPFALPPKGANAVGERCCKLIREGASCYRYDRADCSHGGYGKHKAR